MSVNKDIIISIKKGDPLAFKGMYDQFVGRLYAFCFSYCRSREFSEEVVQEVFIKIWENRAKLDEKKSFNSYLFTITKNHMVDKLRKNSMEQLHQKEIAYLREVTCNQAEDEVIYADYQQLFMQAIQFLPTKCRSIFQLSRIHHKTYAEIADLKGISQKTVEVQIGKALKLMRNYFSTHTDIISVVFFLIFLR